MTISYNRDIPNATNSPSVDQPNMKINTNAIDQIISVDHVNFNQSASTPGGYHNIIHQIPFTTPGNIAGIGQLFSQNYNAGGILSTDTQLYYLTGGGGLSQLTGNQALSDGWSWMGGMLVQWGRLTPVSTGSFAGGNAAGTVTFQSRAANMIPFPTNCFFVVTNAFFVTASVPSGAGAVGVNQQTLSKTKFDWRFNSNSSSYTGFFWVAIGN